MTVPGTIVAFRRPLRPRLVSLLPEGLTDFPRFALAFDPPPPDPRAPPVAQDNHRREH